MINWKCLKLYVDVYHAHLQTLEIFIYFKNATLISYFDSYFFLEENNGLSFITHSLVETLHNSIDFFHMSDTE